ncbi:MAG TPA: RecQ family ATP-dependent DNA helicase [Alkalispirochaeta sp.]|nr:RecQ family ATP-dependent DNA helicase [Alkalispirochaeta sp.]
MDDEYLQCARTRFGLNYLFPYQRLVIATLVESLRADEGSALRDDAGALGRQIVILPTGAGKSLCFQLPAALCGGTTLIVYPLLGLMNDQERRMRDAGFSVRQLRGGQDSSSRNEIFAEVSRGSLDILITNPETLATESVRRALELSPPVHAVVDEAHCISEWGDTFRPAYTTLGESLDRIGISRRTAFTATASDRVIERIRTVLFAHTGASVVRGNPDRPNITYSVVPTLSIHHALQSMFGSPRPNEKTPESTTTLPVWRPGRSVHRPALVFCRTRAETEAIARLLAELLPAGTVRFYHAGLARERKEAIEQEFFKRSDAILASTCAYGMGVDKSDIRTVIHTYVPETAEAFLQESGRGGRDHMPAQSILLLTPEEQTRYQQLSTTGTHSPVQQMAFGTSCRRTALLHHFGVEGEQCSGCDRCEHVHSTPSYSHAAALILAALHCDPVRRGERAWVRILTGRLSHSDRLKGLARHSAVGALCGWQPHHVLEAFSGLTDLGLVSRARSLRPTNPVAVGDRTDLLLPFRLPQIALDSSHSRRRQR